LLRLLRMDARLLQRESWAFGRARAEIRQFVRRNRTRPIEVRLVRQHVRRKLEDWHHAERGAYDLKQSTQPRTRS
jgi:hypothetical protein